MVQWLKTLVTFAEDLGLHPRMAHNYLNSSSRSKALFWSPQVLHAHDTHTYLQTNTHIH